MSMEINTGNTQKTTMSPAMYESLSKTSGEDSTELKEVVSKAMEVLAGANLSVTKSDTAGVGGTAEKKTTGSTNVPALDDPGDSRQIAMNLEKLVSYLQLDNQERQTEQAKERIELQQETLDSEHEDRMSQIDDSIQKMKDAEKASTISRIFGWIGAVLAVAAAVALTVVTGGVAAGFAIAGAVLAVSSLVLNETGAMDSMTTALSEHLQSAHGMSKKDAQLAASLIINLSITAASLACSIGGMVAGLSSAAAAAANTADTVQKVAGLSEQTARTIQTAITVANTGAGAGSLAASGTSTYFTYRSETSKADTTEMEKFIKTLQQRLDECEEELQRILEQMESNIGTIAQMLSSATDTSTEIAQNLGAMA